MTYCDVIEEPREPQAKPFWTVAIYLVDRALGGHEEGGWWYDYGQRCDDHVYGVEATEYLSVFPSLEAAQAFCRSMNDRLKTGANEGRREISSILSDGIYEAQVYNGYPPAYWPEERPVYS